MKFLFDQNLSPRLIASFQDIFPGSRHVRDLGLHAASDTKIWDYAKEHDLIIVSKDDDFRQMSFAFGHPPKVVWLILGNCATADVEALLRRAHTELLAFNESETDSFLVLT